MQSYPLNMIFTFLLLSYFVCNSVVTAKHIHNRPFHGHHLRRQDLSLSSSTDSDSDADPTPVVISPGPVTGDPDPEPTPVVISFGPITGDPDAESTPFVISPAPTGLVDPDSGDDPIPDLEACLDILPLNLTFLVADLDARLSNVTTQLANMMILASSLLQRIEDLVAQEPLVGSQSVPCYVGSSGVPSSPAPSGNRPTTNREHSSTPTTHTTKTSTHVTYHVPVPTSSLTNCTSKHARDTQSPSMSHAPPSSTPYVFNPHAYNNVAAYYGSTPATSYGGLISLCEDPNVDIVILSFVDDFFSTGNYPSVNFGSTSCTGPNDYQAESAPGLKDCSILAPQIKSCQALGKKVLVSLGGYGAKSTFTSDDQARDFATKIWNLFGGGMHQDTGLRPFGSDVVVDGFDMDNESHNPSHYVVFARALRSLFITDSSKDYYLSAAPQCPIPDASIPDGALQQTDFVFVQFYNNPSCELDSDGFAQSLQSWSDLLSNNTYDGGPRVYIGAGAWPGAGSGYVPAAQLQTAVNAAMKLTLPNLGGIALWDGSEAMENQDEDGSDYLYYSKWALGAD